MDHSKIPDIIKRQLAKKRLSPYRAAVAFGMPENAIRYALEGRATKSDRLMEICAALGLEFYIGPPRDAPGAASPDSHAPAPAWTAFSAATLPHRGMATCSVQGWAKAQPERDPIPRPEDIMDDTAFWVSATGQSMIPEGIDGGDVCLVSPGREVREGDRVWILDHQKRAAIKRLVEKRGDGTLKLRSWMPKRDGRQQSFDEERMPAGIREVCPVVAVFRGRPGTEGAEYIPDPKPPAHDTAPGPSRLAPEERIPRAITDLLGLSEGASADAVLAAIKTSLAGRGPAHATPAAALERKLERTLRSETRSLKDDLAAMLDARLPPVPQPGGLQGTRRLTLRHAPDVLAAAGSGADVFGEEVTGHVICRRALIPGALSRATMEPAATASFDLDASIFVIRTARSWSPRPGGRRMAHPRHGAGRADHIVGRVVWFGPEGACHRPRGAMTFLVLDLGTILSRAES